MVDHEVDRDERVDLVDIAAHPRHRRAHRGQVDHAGDAGEVLEDDTSRQIGQLDVRRGLGGIPVGEGRHVIRSRELRADVAEQVFEHDSDHEGEAVDIGDAGLGQFRQAVDRVGMSAGIDRAAHTKGIAYIVGRKTSHD